MGGAAASPHQTSPIRVLCELCQTSRNSYYVNQPGTFQNSRGRFGASGQRRRYCTDGALCLRGRGFLCGSHNIGYVNSGGTRPGTRFGGTMRAAP